MTAPKSIAIIGEGETEWFYFESLRIACRYPFKIAPDMPQHSDIPHMLKMAEQYLAKEYDIVICLVDMDRLLADKKELAVYRDARRRTDERIMWIETNPCTEFWFLLHFLPELSVKHYDMCDEVVTELQKYMPGYDKSVRYLRKIRLYEFLKEHGDISRAMQYAGKLQSLSLSSPEDRIAYSQINQVLELLAQWNNARSSDEGVKYEKSERIGEVEMRILNFLADFPDSDVKSISQAIGLRASRTADYLKRLLEDKAISCSSGWRKTYRRLE